MEPLKAPRVLCPECGAVQPHLSTDVGEYFDCLECSEPLEPPDHDGPANLTCRDCGAPRQFVCGPMVVVTGAPGVGKTVLGVRLAPRLTKGIVLEVPEHNLTKRDPLTIMNMFKGWLVVSAQIAQSGHYLVMTAFARPDELDLLPERRWVGEIHWLALVCSADELSRRLRHRRKSRTIGPAEVAGLVGINDEIRRIAAGDPRVLMLDTTAMTFEAVVDAAADAIESWVGR